MNWRRWADALWFLAWAVGSSVWCVTAAAQLGTTFDEPLYLKVGLKGWRNFSHWEVLQYGTMPLPVDVQTLPLYLWELATDSQIDPECGGGEPLFWMRVGNLVFWWLLLWYGRQVAKLLAGPWAGRLAVAMLASEPNLLAHAALATTDISITACLLALVYHFRVGREAGWFRRLALPAFWFGMAISAKASAVMYGPICLAAIELERLIRSGALACPQDITWLQRLVAIWRQLRPARRDLTWIGLGGLVVTVLYCGSDFRPLPSIVEWANSVPRGQGARRAHWIADHLYIFSNAFEGIVRQIKHNVRGHGTYLLGVERQRAFWYYFPVLLTIKLCVPILLAPLAVGAVNVRALANWACWTALALLVFSLTFRVQIGIRLVLPLVSIAIVGLAAAIVEAARSAKGQWARPALATAAICGVLWMSIASAAVWPEGLCYVNEFWGGTEHGYELVGDSNYDWGQGLPELSAWQENYGAEVDVWCFGHFQTIHNSQLRNVPLHGIKIDGPQDVVDQLKARYLAVGTTMLYGQSNPDSAQRAASTFLRQCRPVDRTTTFLIFERKDLIEACQRLARLGDPLKKASAPLQ